MRFALLSLKAIHNNGVSARIPHQSAARTSLADSFSPGEASAAYGGRTVEDAGPYMMSETFRISVSLLVPVGPSNDTFLQSNKLKFALFVSRRGRFSKKNQKMSQKT